MGEAEHVVLLTMHHIITDGWSMGVLVKEVAALYEVYRRGEQSPLPELEIQYADFAVWQREWLQGEVLDAELSYWKNNWPTRPRCWSCRPIVHDRAWRVFVAQRSRSC